MTNLDSVLKSRDITLPINVHIVKAMVFPVVMCRCESWTIKNAEHQRINAFELWCWSRLLTASWTIRRSNQLVLKEINPEYSLLRLILKLKLWCFDVWCENWLTGKDSSDRKDRRQWRRKWQRMRWLDSITDSMDMNLSKFLEIVKNRGAWCAAVHGVTENQTQFIDCATTTLRGQR